MEKWKGSLGSGLGSCSFGSTELGFLGLRNFDAGSAAAKKFPAQKLRPSRANSCPKQGKGRNLPERAMEQ